MKEKQGTKRDIERTREKILKAAATEFAENGLKGARVDAIAKRAKINKAMIYYIFGGKEELHLAVLRQMIETKTKPVQKTLSDKSIQAEDFLSIIDRYFDDFEELKEYSRILLDDISSGAKALQRLKSQSPEIFRVLNDVSTAIKYFMDKGEMFLLDPDITVMAAVMLMVSFTSLQPYMMIAAPPGSEAHQNLSDPEKWKQFLMSLLTRVFRQPL